jgi:Na+-transporting NADH:ubiquinone oxidoreductase subunit C
MANESVKKTVIVALGVCIVCSILVSTAAVALRGIQLENKKNDRIKNILIAGDLLVRGADIRAMYQEKIEPAMIDLHSGDILSAEDFNETLNIDNFDIKTMADDPEYGIEIPDDRDRANIKRMPKYMVVYFVKENNKTEKVILPIYGKGLWSTMYGFIALGKDLNTVKGFTFHEHAETPGLGGEVDNPRWKNSWKGKHALDEGGNVKIEVIKGRVDTSRPESKHQIDGLSGATLTARGVDHLVKFWLGNDGYGLFLKRLKEELHSGTRL